MKRGVTHWHIFVVFAVVAFGLLFLSFRTEVTGQSLKHMVMPYDSSYAEEYAEREKQKSEWLSSSPVVGEQPSLGKIIAGGILLFSALVIFVLMGIHSKDRKLRASNNSLNSIIRQVKNNK